MHSHESSCQLQRAHLSACSTVLSSPIPTALQNRCLCQLRRGLQQQLPIHTHRCSSHLWQLSCPILLEKMRKEWAGTLQACLPEAHHMVVAPCSQRPPGCGIPAVVQSTCCAYPSHPLRMGEWAWRARGQRGMAMNAGNSDQPSIRACCLRGCAFVTSRQQPSRSQYMLPTHLCGQEVPWCPARWARGQACSSKRVGDAANMRSPWHLPNLEVEPDRNCDRCPPMHHAPDFLPQARHCRHHVNELSQ